jgi:[ribosomal protein S18]-alanine N-acetyltransferase
MIIRPYLATDKPDCLEAFKSNMPEFFAPAELPDFESWLDQQATPPATDESKSKEQSFQYRIALIKSISPGCTIVLDTSQHAYPFFQKLGFVIMKITRDFYAKGIDRYDMELK